MVVLFALVFGVWWDVSGLWFLLNTLVVFVSFVLMFVGGYADLVVLRYLFRLF